MSFIPEEEYARILEVLPILCVDIAVRNSKGEYLLVKRGNEPLKGEWWVPGGRVLKGETLEQAAIRKVEEEVGIKVDSVKPMGYYEDTAHTNRFASRVPLHSVSVVFLAVVDDFDGIKLDSQSLDWKRAKEMPEDFLIKRFMKM